MDLEAIYQQEFAWTGALLRRCGVADKDLKDAVHDTFLVVHRKLDAFDRNRPIRPWIGGIAVRIASEWRRRASVRREIPGDVPERVDEGPGAHAILEQRRAREHVVAALATLSDEQREVFVLHELEGLPIPDIAASHGVRLNTMYSRLRLARQAFTAAVRARVGKEEMHG